VICLLSVALSSHRHSFAWRVIVHSQKKPWTWWNNFYTPPTLKMLCLRHIFEGGFAWFESLPVVHTKSKTDSAHEILKWCTRDSPENLVKNFRNPFVRVVARSKQWWLIFSIFFWFSIESIVEFLFYLFTSDEKVLGKNCLWLLRSQKISHAN
jgi:hypothetical protein